MFKCTIDPRLKHKQALQKSAKTICSCGRNNGDLRQRWSFEALLAERHNLPTSSTWDRPLYAWIHMPILIQIQTRHKYRYKYRHSMQEYIGIQIQIRIRHKCTYTNTGTTNPVQPTLHEYPIQPHVRSAQFLMTLYFILQQNSIK